MAYQEILQREVELSLEIQMKKPKKKQNNELINKLKDISLNYSQLYAKVLTIMQTSLSKACLLHEMLQSEQYCF